MHILGMSLRGLMRQRPTRRQAPTQAAAIAPRPVANAVTGPSLGTVAPDAAPSSSVPAGAPSGMEGALADVAARAKAFAPGASPIAPTTPGSQPGSMGGILSRFGGGGTPSANQFGIDPNVLHAYTKGGTGAGLLSGIGARVPLGANGVANPSPQGNSTFGALTRLGQTSPNAGNEGNPGNSNINAPMNAPSDASGLLSRMKQAVSDQGENSSEY